MADRAYLVLWIGVEKPWPELLGAGIYSEQYPSAMLHRRRPVPIFEARARDFESAKRVIVQHFSGPGQEWVRALLDKGMPDWNKPNPMIGKTVVGQMP